MPPVRRGTLNVSRAVSGRPPLSLSFRKPLPGGTPCRLYAGTRSTFRVPSLGAPHCPYPVESHYRGARHAAGTPGDTLNVSRAVPGRPPLSLSFRKPLPGGTPCRLYAGTRSMFRVPYWAPPNSVVLTPGLRPSAPVYSVTPTPCRGAKNPLTRGRCYFAPASSPAPPGAGIPASAERIYRPDG
jgi:hypothetical protein